MDLCDMDIRDKIKLCDLLFKTKMYNELYRIRSFDAYPKLQPHAKQLAALGMYFCGKYNHKAANRTLIYMTCAFCSFVHRVGPANCTDFNFNALKYIHAEESNIKCRLKYENIPHDNKLAKYNVHFTTDEPFPMQALATSQIAELPATELAKASNKPLICPVCSKREIDIVFLTCKCCCICSYCASQYPGNTCIKCNAKILGYAKVVIT
jgi:hypothetical protein